MLKEAAENTLIDYRNALSIIQSVREDVDPCVLKCSALNKEGIKEIWHQIKIFERKRKKTKSFQKIEFLKITIGCGNYYIKM